MGTFNPATGETAELMDMGAYGATGLRYNAATDTVYFASRTEVLSTDNTFKTLKVSAYLPNQVWDDGAFMLVGGSYAVADYNGLVVRQLDPPGIEDGALTIYGDYNSKGHLAFTAQNPSVAVTCSDNYYSSLEEFTNAMVANTDTVDVLRLDSSYSPLETLVAKGYAMDLSGDAELTAYAQSLYPEFADFCSVDGKLYAVPISLYATTIGYSKTVWSETLGLTEADLPTSLYGLLDFVENWGYDYADDYPDLKLFENSSAKSTLLNLVFENYIAYYDQLGEPLTFDTELFRKLIQKIDGIDFSEIDPAEDEADTDEFWNRSAVFSEYVSISSPADVLSDYATPLVLPLDDGMQPVISTNLSVLIINPRTTRSEQALAYLHTYVQNNDEERDNITLFPDHNEPILNKNFEQNLDSWKETLETLNKQLETAEPENVADIKSSITYFEDLIENSDRYRYTVSAEAITAYRERIAPYIHIMGQTPLTTWNKDGENDFQTQISQYLQGAITADGFIKEIDKRVRMMQLEDQ